MSKKCEEDVTANALALEIFRDNLKLHEQIDYMKRERAHIRAAVIQHNQGDEGLWARFVYQAVESMVKGHVPP